MSLSHLIALIVFMTCLTATQAANDCSGTKSTNLGGVKNSWKLADGGVAAYAKMNINVDGYARAYHRKNYKTDAILHLCNAGRVYLPNGESYEGSESNATCTKRFMSDVARIETAGWINPQIGVVQWYGILGTEQVVIAGKTITSVKPVLQRDGSGYYVSPTSLFDASIVDLSDQQRYVHPLKVPSAVIPRSLIKAGIEVGSYGVAINRNKNIAVPFVVGDTGPRIGEGTPALARLVAGMPASDTISRENRYLGQVDTPDILWLFFADVKGKYEAADPAKTVAAANTAYEKWGGYGRLQSCLNVVPPN